MTRSMLMCLVLVCGCASQDPSGPPLDPIGAWHLTATWTGGSCGLSGAANSTMIVVQGPSGYLINESDPSTHVTGSISCDSMFCDMSVTESGSSMGVSTTATYSLALDSNGQVSGDGSFAILGSPGCEQSFDVAGTKS